MFEMYSRKLVFIGALLAALGVGFGAIGAHFLPKYLEAKQFDRETVEKRMEQFETGVRYHLFHSFALVVVGLSKLSGRLPGAAAGLILIGLLLFSGGIYGIVFGELQTHIVVPIGGFAFIAGWLTLALAALATKAL
jgi:uncharacterized membrane protein YgdD (TMEM256/DUF423 family)